MNEPRKKRGPLPPVFFLAALLASIALHYGLPLATILPEPWNLAGIFPLVLGLCAILVSAVAFGRAGTAIIPFEESSALVVNGFYRYTRNPMYLGMLLVLLGVAMLLGTLTPYLSLPPFVWIIQRRFILREEAMLEQRFGDDYRAFRQRVRRWL